MSESRQRRSISTAGLAADIMRLLRRDGLRAGDRLVELRLARELGLSRSPLRRALSDLAARGLIKAQPNRGYVLVEQPNEPEFAPEPGVDADQDTAYLKIAADRLDRRLPDVVTETALARDYALSRPEVSRILARMAREGWIERRAGYGWQFLSMFPTPEAYFHGYRYRLLVEPAALLEPGYLIGAETLDRIEADQLRMARPDASGVSVIEMFDIGCSFHETIVAASGNPFMLDAVQRINRMRRLIEYRTLAPGLVSTQSTEHLAIIRALRQRNQSEASRLLHEHLASAAVQKMQRLPDFNPEFGPAPV